MTNLHSATYSPGGAICTKCKEEILPTGVGRRFRMQWYHENCLPETRIKKLTKFRTDEARLERTEQSIERSIARVENLATRISKLKSKDA